MLIILEGVDRCGKSTLANVLSKELDWPVIHHSRPTARSFDLYLESMAQLRKHKNAIFDRFYWSEIVYGNVFRGGHDLSKLELEALEQWCIDRNTLVMYLGDTAKAIRSRWTPEETAKDGSADHIEALQDEYDKILKVTPIPYSRSTLSSWVDDKGDPAWRTRKLVQSIREGSSL